jgi:hypothetical protein
MTYAEAHAPMASGVRLMSWPMGLCLDCAHPSHIERRRELRTPCALCLRPILNGESYRELVRVNGRLEAWCHETCREAEASAVVRV